MCDGITHTLEANEVLDVFSRKMSPAADYTRDEAFLQGPPLRTLLIEERKHDITRAIVGNNKRFKRAWMVYRRKGGMGLHLDGKEEVQEPLEQVSFRECQTKEAGNL